MKLTLRHREAQHSVALFGGRLRENKPLAGGDLYSNLIYWAHVEAPEEGTFPMHPHEGIEILTFIFEGGLEHYDTATNVWTPLAEGGVQLIQAGKGVQHSEKYIKGSRAFQIWFDPDFSKALQKNAYYKDFQPDSFHWERKNGFEEMTYVGQDGPIKTDAPGIGVKCYKIPSGNHRSDLDQNSFHSLYLLNGEMNIDNKKLVKDSFLKVEGANQLNLDANVDSELFILQSPVNLDYKRV